ncbi:MAG: DUF3332 family protein [Lentisphaeria bacterium]
MMKKIVLATFAAATLIMSTGCTGPFRLTSKLYNWQTSFDDKWGDELAFLGCVILPVYGLTLLGDAIIFNSIEFWGGNNPVASVNLEQDGKLVKMIHNADDSITVRATDGTEFTLVRTEDGVVAKDAAGKITHSVAHTENGMQIVEAK